MKKSGKELIKEVLEKWKFPVLAENETGVVFRYQISYIQGSSYGNDDSDAVALNLEGVFTADTEEKMEAAIKTCNELTANLLHVKLFINKENKLTISSEFFYRSEEDMEYMLEMGLKSIVTAKRRFLSRYPEIEEEIKLMSQLEDSTLEADSIGDEGL